MAHKNFVHIPIMHMYARRWWTLIMVPFLTSSKEVSKTHFQVSLESKPVDTTPEHQRPLLGTFEMKRTQEISPLLIFKEKMHFYASFMALPYPKTQMHKPRVQLGQEYRVPLTASSCTHNQ